MPSVTDSKRRADESELYQASFTEFVSKQLLNLAYYAVCPWALLFDTDYPAKMLDEIRGKSQWPLSAVAKLLLFVAFSVATSVFLCTWVFNIFDWYRAVWTDASMRMLLFSSLEAEYQHCLVSFKGEAEQLAGAVSKQLVQSMRAFMDINATDAAFANRTAEAEQRFFNEPMKIPLALLASLKSPQAERLYDLIVKKADCQKILEGWVGMPASLAVYLQKDYAMANPWKAIFLPPLATTVSVAFYCIAYVCLLYGTARLGATVGDVWRCHIGQSLGEGFYSHSGWTVFFALAMFVTVARKCIPGVEEDVIMDNLFSGYMHFAACVATILLLFLSRVALSKWIGSRDVPGDLLPSSIVIGTITFFFIVGTGFDPASFLASSLQGLGNGIIGRSLNFKPKQP